MKYLVGNAPDSSQYVKSTFDEFLVWVAPLKEYQLDIETDITQFYSNKKLIVVSFGDDEDNQWVIQLSYLSFEQRAQLKVVLENPKPMKLAHNGVFEYVVLRFHDMQISNIYDTMLAEKVIYGGSLDDEMSYSLASTTYRYLGIILSKDEQTTFGDDVLTESKVVYAASDVKYLQSIKRMQMQMLSHLDQDWVMALESEALLSYGDMTYHGMKFNPAKWRENIALAAPIVDEAKKKLDEWLTKEPFSIVAKIRGYISDEDRVEIKWSSPIQRTTLLRKIIPDIPGGSKGVVGKYLKTKLKEDPFYKYGELIQGYLDKDYSILEKVLLDEHKDFLVTNGFLTPGGIATVNWNSVVQALPLLRTVEPRLADLSKDSMDKTTHPITADYKEYKDYLKLNSTYGEKFIEKYLEPDGHIRTNFNQVVSTGRVSSSRPNLQNIPAKKKVGARYRECFGPDEGWVVVGSDYSSQEAVLAAQMSRDPVWLRALKNNEDLHSVCAELIFGREWIAGKEDGCEYYTKGAHQKCHCKKHGEMREKTKTINYGLIYGMSPMKLSGMLKIPLKEAKALMKKYFETFPRIKGMLNTLSRMGITQGYSTTMAPFFRKRWYPEWKYALSYIPAHLAGIQYNKTLGEIERQAGNHAIQGSAADMMKIATVMVRQYIYGNNLQDKIHIVSQVHDELITFCKKYIAEEWSIVMNRLMEDAAKIFVPSGLLKADTSISLTWTK